MFTLTSINNTRLNLKGRRHLSVFVQEETTDVERVSVTWICDYSYELIMCNLRFVISVPPFLQRNAKRAEDN